MWRIENDSKVQQYHRMFGQQDDNFGGPTEYQSYYGLVASDSAMQRQSPALKKK